MAEATPEFKQHLREAFETAYVGQTFTYRRTFSDGDVAIFCGVTGDFNPYHQDDLFTQDSWFKRRIVPGLLTGSMLTHIGGMISFLAAEMHFQFLQPVYIGDTITCTLTFTEKDEVKRKISASARMVNQNGIEVINATLKGIPGNIRLAK